MNELWDNGDYKLKRKVQSLSFPEGVILAEDKTHYLTKKTNSIFNLIHDFQSKIEENKKGLTDEIINKSLVVAGTGLEPATSGL